MTVQTVPFALQNASHSAALFRQSASAPFTSGGILAAGELTITQQGTPNMSVVLGAGRAKIAGTSVSPPSGLSFTTQGMYDVLNDAPLTITVAAADATNPRIDVPYIQVQDSFYSGAANQAIAGIVTGTPAPSPTTPAVPSNAIGLNPIAVAANATSIVSANIGASSSLAVLIGGLRSFASAALRDAAIPSPTTGLQIYRSDTGWVEEYFSTVVATPGWYPVYGSLPFCSLGMATAQNANPAAFAITTWDVERADVLNWHNPASNPSRITVQQAGRYKITAHVRSSIITATAYVGLQFTVNGVAVDYTQNIITGNTVNFTSVTITTAYQLAVGDYVEVQAIGASSGTTAFVVTASMFQLEYTNPI